MSAPLCGVVEVSTIDNRQEQPRAEAKSWLTLTGHQTLLNLLPVTFRACFGQTKRSQNSSWLEVESNLELS